MTCARASDEPALHSGNDEKAKRALTEEDIQELANDFASALPEGDFSTAQVQGEFCFRSLGQTPAEKCNTYLGMLMGHRDYPGEAVDAVAEWVAEKRKEKEEDVRKQYVIIGNAFPLGRSSVYYPSQTRRRGREGKGQRGS